MAHGLYPMSLENVLNRIILGWKKILSLAFPKIPDFR